MSDYNLEKCPKCGGETEFVQFGGATNDVVETTPEEVGDGILALYACLECEIGLEYVLQPSEVTVIDA
jgi:hypothetical protein